MIKHRANKFYPKPIDTDTQWIKDSKYLTHKHAYTGLSKYYPDGAFDAFQVSGPKLCFGIPRLEHTNSEFG